MNEQQLKDEIEARKECIASIETNLMYADHGAYGQDKEKIRRLKDEIALFEKELVEIKAAPEPVEQDIVPQLTARRVLKISTRQTLGNWIARGRVNGYKVHGETWVSLKECRAWIANPARKGGRPMIRFD